jgi:hypothetical protein
MYDFTVCQVLLQVLPSTDAAEKNMIVNDDTLICDFVPHFSMKHPGDVYSKTLRINECYSDALKALWWRTKFAKYVPVTLREEIDITFENTAQVLFSTRCRALNLFSPDFPVPRGTGLWVPRGTDTFLIFLNLFST